MVIVVGILKVIGLLALVGVTLITTVSPILIQMWKDDVL